MTTQGLFNYVINKDKKADICDDCSLVAYDAGIEGWDAQVDFMVMMGADAYDHLCNANVLMAHGTLNVDAHGAVGLSQRKGATDENF